MKLCGFLSIHNEVEKGNLRRCLESLATYCDCIVIYDDASTDNSVEVAKEFTDLIIEGKVNEWGKEAEHRQELLQLALAQKPDWIFWIDADEVIEARGESFENGGIRDLCKSEEFDCYAFHETNLWRSESFYRVDNSYNDGWFCRLWKNTGELEIENKPGLHQRLVPPSLKSEGRAPLQIIHYGFASDSNILDKYHTYKQHGQTGWALHRLVDERTLHVKRVNPLWFHSSPVERDPNEVYRIPLVNKL